MICARPGSQGKEREQKIIFSGMRIYPSDLKIRKCDNRQAEKRERTHDLKYIFLWPSETSDYEKIFCSFVWMRGIVTDWKWNEPREKMKSKHENFIILLRESFEKLKTNAERTPRIFKTNKERTKRNQKIEQVRNRREIKIEAATKRRKRKNELRKNSEKNNFAVI